MNMQTGYWNWIGYRTMCHAYKKKGERQIKETIELSNHERIRTL